MRPIAIFDQSMNLLSKVLDLRAENEKIIASNIANSETPGYSAVRFSFEDELKSAVNKRAFAVNTTHQSHIPILPSSINAVTGKITTHPDLSGIGDQNSVSLDSEMISLSENEILYETAAQMLKKKLTIMKHVVSGGQ